MENKENPENKERKTMSDNALMAWIIGVIGMIIISLIASMTYYNISLNQLAFTNGYEQTSQIAGQWIKTNTTIVH